MYLSKLRVQGFRCFDNEFSVTFNSGLNVIVGENGAGKTAAINAIRQLFSDSEAGRYASTMMIFILHFQVNSISHLTFQFQLTSVNLAKKKK